MRVQWLSLVGVGVLALGVGLETLLFRDGFSPVALALMTGVGASCLAASIWRARPRAEWRYVSLGAVFCLYFAISFGFAIGGTPPLAAQRVLPDGLAGIDLSAIPAGMLAWFLGYRVARSVGPARVVRNFLLPASTVRAAGPATLWFFFGVTVAARLVLLISGAGFGYLQDAEAATTSVSSSGQYLSQLGEFGLIVLAVTMVASAQQSDTTARYRRAYLVMIPIEVVLRTIGGTKTGIFLLMLVIVLTLVAIGRLRLRVGRLAVVGVVAIVLVFPLVGSYRELVRPADGSRVAPVDAPTAAAAAVGVTVRAAADGPQAYVGLAFDQSTSRFREIDRAAVSLQAHQHGLPFSSPTEMPTRIAVGLVPRVLWPGKPLNLYALEVSRQYYGLPSTVLSSASLSPIGDAYRYGGLPVVVVALGLLGALTRLLDEALSPRHSLWLVPVLVATIPLLRGGDLASLVVGMVRYFLLLGLFYRLLFIRSVRGAESSGLETGTSTTAGRA